MFKATFTLKFSEKDNYKNGCNPQTAMTNVVNIVITGESVKELLANVSRYFNADRESLLLDSCDEIGRLDVQTYTKTLSGNKCTYNKHKDGFVEGDYDLWLHCFVGEVTTTPTIVNLTEAVKASQ